MWTGRDPLFLQTYASLVLTLAYLLPLALLSRNYVIVIFFVTKKARLLQGQVSRAKIRVLRSIITVTVAFVVLWLPFFVLFTIEASDVGHAASDCAVQLWDE